MPHKAKTAILARRIVAALRVRLVPMIAVSQSTRVETVYVKLHATKTADLAQPTVPVRRVRLAKTMLVLR